MDLLEVTTIVKPSDASSLGALVVLHTNARGEWDEEGRIQSSWLT